MYLEINLYHQFMVHIYQFIFPSFLDNICLCHVDFSYLKKKNNTFHLQHLYSSCAFDYFLFKLQIMLIICFTHFYINLLFLYKLLKAPFTKHCKVSFAILLLSNQIAVLILFSFVLLLPAFFFRTTSLVDFHNSSFPPGSFTRGIYVPYSIELFHVFLC